MRPKIVLLILVIIEVFLLLIFFSPSVGLSMQRTAAESEYRRNPSPENGRVAEEKITWDRFRPVIVGGLASTYRDRPGPAPARLLGAPKDV